MTQTLLLAAALALVCVPAMAGELTRYILVQPLTVIRSICAHVDAPDWGCVTFDRAVDNHAVVFCYLHIPVTERPWEENALLERLRPLCLEGQGR